MNKKRPISRKISGCDLCIHRSGDFFNDSIDTEIIRCYCKARHTSVDAELMTKLCDFFSLDPERKEKDENKTETYGI